MIFGAGGSFILEHSLLSTEVDAGNPMRIFQAADYVLAIPQEKEIHFQNYKLELSDNQQVPEPHYPSPRLSRFSDLSIQIEL